MAIDGQQQPGGASTLQHSAAEPSRYVKIKDLSRGSFGTVVLAQDTQTNEQVALKYMPRGPQNISTYTEREIINHMKLRHPHVIALREVFLTSTHLVLAMEFAAGGDLADYTAARHGLTEAKARHFFQQLIVALDYCHRMGVSSRDIKLQNLLLDASPRPLLKLADFGFSKDADQHSAPNSRVGTPAYLAPEVVKLQLGQKYDGQKADIWSAGVALFVMLTNQYPFRRRSDDALGAHQKLHAMLVRVLQADFSFPAGRQLSDDVRDLISRILVADPEKRPTIQEIMAHPWFAQGLNPEVLRFNDSMVQISRDTPPAPAVLDEVRALVRHAAEGPLGAELEEAVDCGSAEGHVAVESIDSA